MSPLVPLSGRALQWQLWKMQTGACSSPGYTCRLWHQCQQVSALTQQPFQVCFDFTGILNTSVGGTCSSEFIWKRGSKGPYISPVPSSFMNFRDQVPMIALPQASESVHFLPKCFQMSRKADIFLPSFRRQVQGSLFGCCCS